MLKSPEIIKGITIKRKKCANCSNFDGTVCEIDVDNLEPDPRVDPDDLCGFWDERTDLKVSYQAEDGKWHPVAELSS